MVFKNKVVWITGASSGIGEALTVEFAKQGARLVLSARREDELTRVAKASGLSENNVMILPMDVTEFDKMPQHVEAVVSRMGSIDVLINNAGISSRGLVIETELSVYQRMMDVDFFSTVALSKAVLPHMTSKRSGRIVVVSSLMGKFSTPYRSAYCAAKHALHGFYDALRAELYQHNVGVSIICPGFVSTEISFNALNTKGEQRKIQDHSNQNGMAPSAFAAKMVAAIAKEKDEAYIGGWEVRGIYAKRFLPGLLNRMMRSFKP